MGAPSKRARKIREASEFNLARLRAELAIPKSGTGVIFSWSLEEIFRARDAQMRGNFLLPARMAESMRTDDALFVAYGNRLDPQRCTPVEIVPASQKAKALSVAGEAEGLFGQDGVGLHPGALSDVNGCLVNHGVAFGVCVATPRDDGSRVDYEMKYWPIEFVRWDPFLKVFLARVDPDSVPANEVVPANLPDTSYRSLLGTYEVPIVHGDGRWVIFSNHEVEPFKQEAALLPASAVWARHAFAIRDWSKGSVAHGNAKFVGEMPVGVALQKEGGLTPEAAAMVELLRSLASDDSPVGLRPAGSKTDFLTNLSSAWQVWAELVGNGEKAAARIYLGTDGTLGTTGGAPGVDITELLGVAITKVRGDLGCIERCLLTGVIEPWAAVNFGDSTLAPCRRYKLPDDEQEKLQTATATRRSSFFADIKAARDNGFAVTQDYVDETAKVYDVLAPTLPEETDVKVPTVALAPTDLARVITVNEARAAAGLGPLALADGSGPDPDGTLTVEQYGIKKGAELAPKAPGPTPAAPP